MSQPEKRGYEDLRSLIDQVRKEGVDRTEPKAKAEAEDKTPNGASEAAEPKPKERATSPQSEPPRRPATPPPTFSGRHETRVAEAKPFTRKSRPSPGAAERALEWAFDHWRRLALLGVLAVGFYLARSTPGGATVGAARLVPEVARHQVETPEGEPDMEVARAAPQPLDFGEWVVRREARRRLEERERRAALQARLRPATPRVRPAESADRPAPGRNPAARVIDRIVSFFE